MRRKQCHCVRLVFLIPIVYLLSQTKSVWRRYHDMSAKPNRQNFWMLTVPIRTVRTVTWQDRTGHTVMMWQFFIRWLLENWVLTRVLLTTNNMRARGPIHGHHVSLVDWFMIVVCKNYWESAGFDPRTSPHHITFSYNPPTNAPYHVT
jgi:hypothetical protein